MVVYMGDDARFQCLYKFISKGKIRNKAALINSALLDEGTLYVADFLNRKWIELSPTNPLLAKDAKFSKLENILTYTRQAAALVGATPLNRPEAVIVNAHDRSVLMALTNNPKAGDLYGSIVKLKEQDSDAAALTFDSEVLLHGSPELGLVCPDNLAFSPSNYLWVTNDVSALVFKKKAFSPLLRNGIYNVFHQQSSKPSNAPNCNTFDNTIRAWPLLFAPPDAELTGPCFHPNGRDLFVSVQHPGEYSFDSQPGFTSHWPLGKPNLPLSTVIGVQARDKACRF